VKYVKKISFVISQELQSPLGTVAKIMTHPFLTNAVKMRQCFKSIELRKSYMSQALFTSFEETEKHKR
jgi:hypothetical protein